MARKKTPEINASSTADIAFLLLTFFLMTTTMDVDSGLFRRLPPMPPPDQVIAPPVAKRNILQVLVNKNDLLAVNGELMQIENLKEKAKEFILNPQNREDLPSKVVKEIPFFGQAEVSRGIISLQSDRGTSYKMYIAVQDELTAAYNEIRDMKAMEKWGKKYSELTEEQMDAVRKLVPTAISEAEPKNIGKEEKR
ncbi:MAG: ExbD/TolR family protein [Butyricimonas faecihominis]